jgi:hypothetical protein
MEPAQQQQWLRELEERLDRVYGLAPKPEEAPKKKASYNKLLHQKTVSWETLRGLVQETAQREKAAIARLAAQYRIQIYDTFRNERGPYLQRHEALRRVVAAWEQSGKDFMQQGKLVAWLEAAIHNSTGANIAPLPEDPQFEPAPGASSPFSDQPPQPDKHDSQDKKPDSKQDKKADSKQEKKPDSPQDRKADAKPDKKQDGKKETGPGKSGAAPPRRPRPMKNVAGFSPPPAEPAADLRDPVDTLQRRRDLQALPKVSRVPGLAAWAADAPAPTSPPAVAARKGDFPRPTAGKPDGEESKPNHDDIALVSTNQPLRRRHASDKQSWAGPALPRKSVPAPLLLSGRTAKEGEALRAVEVNVDELSARIGGVNLELRALEAELDEDHRWDSRGLAPLIQRLGVLLQRAGDLAMFRELVPEAQRALAGELESPKAVIAQLGRRIFEARSFTASPDFSGTQAERQAELQRLDALSHQLPALAAKA